MRLVPTVCLTAFIYTNLSCTGTPPVPVLFARANPLFKHFLIRKSYSLPALISSCAIHMFPYMVMNTPHLNLRLVSPFQSVTIVGFLIVNCCKALKSKCT